MNRYVKRQIYRKIGKKIQTGKKIKSEGQNIGR